MWKRLAVLWSVVRGDAGALWRALRHPGSPRWLWPAVAAIVVYVVSPLDFIPDFIPILGVVDDVVLVPLAIRFLLRRLPGPVLADIGHRPV